MPGYSVILVNPENVERSVFCEFCHQLLKKAYQATCGHRYCEECVFIATEREPIKCPTNGCGELIKKDTINSDRAADRDVKRVCVFCSGKQAGCRWQGRLQEFLEDHEPHCELVSMSCPNPGCTDYIIRKHLKSHLDGYCSMRLIECRDCRGMIPNKNMLNHQKECPECVIKCRGCGKKIAQKLMDDHMNPDNMNPLLVDKCLAGFISCLYRNLGCKSIMLSREIEHHMKYQLEAHLSMVFRKVNTVKQRIDWDTDRMNTSTQQLVGHNNRNETKLDNLAKYTPEIEKRLVTIQESKNQERYLEPMHKTVNALLGKYEQGQVGCQQMYGDLHDIGIHLQRMGLVDREIREKIAINSRKMAAAEQSFSEKEVTFHEYQKRLNALESTSFDGRYTWRVDNVKKKIGDSETRRLPYVTSPAFYTERTGFKMAVRMYLRGDGTGAGKSLSLFFIILKGIHDEVLRWPFKNKVTMKVLDQVSGNHVTDSFRPDVNSSSFRKPQNEANVPSGFPEFLDLAEFSDPSRGFIKDDVMFVNITVHDD